MKKLNIAICDDTKDICSELENFLNEVLKENGREAEIDIFYTGEALCKAMMDKQYNLVFLDIELPEMNGVDVGKYIREVLKDEYVQIAYISAKEGYAMELFDYRPINFLVKPLDKRKLEKVIRKYLILFAQDNKVFLYKKRYDSFNIMMSEIIYFESNGRKITIVTTTGTDEFYGSLNDVYSQVKGNKFMFIHQSVIVNYNYIKAMHYEEVEMTDGRVFGISQSKRKSIREQYMDMMEDG